MTAEQNAAFAAGAGVDPNTLLIAVAGITLTLAFVWTIWLTVGVFSAWQWGRASLFELFWSVLRACIVLLVLGFHLR